MDPPSYEEASRQPPTLPIAAFNAPPPAYDASLSSPPTPPPAYREAGEIKIFLLPLTPFLESAREILLTGCTH